MTGQWKRNASYQRQPKKHPTTSLICLTIAIASIYFILSSCSDESGDPPSTDAATFQDVHRDYLEYWRVRLEANSQDPRPDDERFEQVATGEQLEALREEADYNQQNGIIYRPGRQTPHNARVASINGDQAIVEDCWINDDLTVDAETGEVINDNIWTNRFEVELYHIDGRWKVDTITILSEAQGDRGCTEG